MEKSMSACAMDCSARETKPLKGAQFIVIGQLDRPESASDRPLVRTRLGWTLCNEVRTCGTPPMPRL
jgi:hypothetical protein